MSIVPRVGGRPAPPPSPVSFVDILVVATMSVGLVIGLALLIEVPRPTVGVVLSLLLVQSAIPMAVIYTVLILPRRIAWAQFGLRRAPRGWIWRALLIALVMLPVVGLVNLGAQALYDGTFRNPQLDMLAPDGFSWAGLAGMLVVVGMIAPAVEEIAFRGLLYGWLRQHVGIAGGAVVSGLAFAAAHGIPLLMPALFLHGIVLALVYERSGSLWPAIVVHGVFNMAMTAALYAALAAGVSLE